MGVGVGWIPAEPSPWARCPCRLSPFAVPLQAPTSPFHPSRDLLAPHPWSQPPQSCRQEGRHISDH